MAEQNKEQEEDPYANLSKKEKKKKKKMVRVPRMDRINLESCLSSEMNI